ncbi:NADPH:quinone reductase [Frondihabitans sp. PAMC 28766]|uniref:NADP-dependent oxidoreductase n=1 Tax=Frondihabitans sp. PAMC 28766 TaxID=1795630 RepID=UPI00078B3324|nr:NADP-dependent oxidoreductase [Frondihabitans sp. PAMC 28766]AMM20923.1 NADPH:quinone reductase [Frondihabitans sp. PAMC 28766]
MSDSPAPEIPTHGRAVRFDHYGDREVLQVVDVEVSPPAAGDVLVEVKAAGTNPGEAAIRQGFLDSMFPATFPSGEGTDFAGVVVSAGGDVTAWHPADEVIGWSEQRSSHADFVTVPAHQLVAKPRGVSWEVAGSLFVVAATATAAIAAIGPKPGQTVVVSSAAGGVGSLVTQLLVVDGVDVISIASAGNHEWLRSVDARPVAYGEGLADRIRELAPNGVDALIDTFGDEYVHLGVELGLQPDRIETIIAFGAAAEIGALSKGSSDASTPEVLAHVAKLLDQGKVTLPIAQTFPLTEVRAAFELLEQHHAHGKVVLVP